MTSLALSVGTRIFTFGEQSGPNPIITAPIITVDQFNEAEIEFNQTSATIDLSGTVDFDGSYVIALAELQQSPKNLVPPSLGASGTASVNETLVIRPGLWVFDGDLATPNVAYSTNGSGTVTNISYAVVPSDTGLTLTVTEQVSDGNGSSSAVSNTVVISG